MAGVTLACTAGMILLALVQCGVALAGRGYPLAVLDFGLVICNGGQLWMIYRSLQP